LSFRLKILLRLLLIIALGSSGLFIVLNTYFWLIGVWLFLFTGIGLWELIRFVEKGDRELSNFLLSLQQNDFTGNYGYSRHEAIERSFDVITSEFKKLRQSSASNLQFLNVVIEQSTVPMIGFRVEGGSIKVYNEAAKELIDKPHINNLKALEIVNEELYELFNTIQTGEKKLIKTSLNNRLYHLSVMAKELRLEDEYVKLITFQNIKQELDQQELESWQKLIRVLTHEIKNSAIPISTLTEVISHMLKNEYGEIRNFSDLDSEDLEDLITAINTIEKRSRGLVKFVNAYGELARVPEPNFQKIELKSSIENVLTLLKQSLKSNKIRVDMEIENLKLNADPDLLEQVLINLIKNAIEVLSDERGAIIKIDARQRENKTIIEIKDNGPGIEEDVLESIFVPFYTTKKTGSGIGLSLSKEIIRVHNGSLSVSTKVDVGTTFSIEL